MLKVPKVASEQPAHKEHKADKDSKAIQALAYKVQPDQQGHKALQVIKAPKAVKVYKD